MEKYPKKQIKFICEKCIYLCSKQSEYNKPILTVKQQKTMNLNNLEHKNIRKSFICKKFNKSYNAKKCILKTDKQEPNKEFKFKYFILCCVITICGIDYIFC